MELGRLLIRYVGCEARTVGAVGTMTGAAALPAEIADWPGERRDAYEERCGIMEFDGLIPREEAQRLAEAEARLDSRKEKGT